MKNISIYPGLSTSKLFKSRKNRSQAIEDACAAYNWLVASNKPKMHRNEWMLIFDALNGQAGDVVEIARGLTFGIADSIDFDSLDKKWNANGEMLKQKLHKLKMPQKITVAEMARRFWSQDHTDKKSWDEVVISVVGTRGIVE